MIVFVNPSTTVVRFVHSERKQDFGKESNMTGDPSFPCMRCLSIIVVTLTVHAGDTAKVAVFSEELFHIGKGGATIVLSTTVAIRVSVAVASTTGAEETDMSGILIGTSELEQVVRAWKGLLLASLGVTEGEVELWTGRRVFLHDGTVAELLYQTLAALHGGVGNLGHLVAIEPALATNGFDKIDNVLGKLEVDECVADVAIVGKVDAEVHEVVLSKGSAVHDGF